MGVDFLYCIWCGWRCMGIYMSKIQSVSNVIGCKQEMSDQHLVLWRMCRMCSIVVQRERSRSLLHVDITKRVELLLLRQSQANHHFKELQQKLADGVFGSLFCVLS